jgi:hypothetical protein
MRGGGDPPAAAADDTLADLMLSPVQHEESTEEKNKGARVLEPTKRHLFFLQRKRCTSTKRRVSIRAEITEHNLPAELFPAYTTVEYQMDNKNPRPPCFMLVLDTTMVGLALFFFHSRC